MQVSFKQLYDASRSCRQGKAKGRDCQRYEANLLTHLFDTQAALQSYTWQPQPMHSFTVDNGSKPREIHAPAYADRVVHHWFVPLLQSIIEPKFIYDCAANIKGKGTHFGVKRLQRMFRQASQAEKKGGAYFLQLDIHNFFYSIEHSVLLKIVQRHLQRAIRKHEISHREAQDLYYLSCQCLRPTFGHHRASNRDSKLPFHKRLHNVAKGCGLPIGNLTSQFFSNVYLNELDQFVKHDLKCRHYVRYVDDFILVHNDKAQLEQWQAQISTFLECTLSLRLKPHIILQPLSQGADFLGYIMRPHYCLVRRRVLSHWHHKLMEWRKQVLFNKVSAYWYCLPTAALEKLQALCASYCGHIQHASYFAVLQQLFGRYPWLQNFFILKGGALFPKWQNARLTRFTAQCQWFVQQYPQHLVFLQKGRHFVEAHEPWREYSLSHLHLLLKGLRKQFASYIWVKEHGYTRHHLKHRQLAQLFIPIQGDLYEQTFA